MGRYASGSKRAVCKTVALRLRRFKSYPAHHKYMAHWYKGYYIGLSLRRYGFDSLMSRQQPASVRRQDNIHEMLSTDDDYCLVEEVIA